MDEFRLCYIDGYWAYFTTQDINDQWGDDWNDAPYEHNAGDPYYYSEYDKQKGRAPWEIKKVAFESNMETPEQIAMGNSRYSVESINRGSVAWLADGKHKPIYAGVTIDEFKQAIWESGGQVYELTEAPQST